MLLKPSDSLKEPEIEYTLPLMGLLVTRADNVGGWEENWGKKWGPRRVGQRLHKRWIVGVWSFLIAKSLLGEEDCDIYSMLWVHTHTQSNSPGYIYHGQKIVCILILYYSSWPKQIFQLLACMLNPRGCLPTSWSQSTHSNGDTGTQYFTLYAA